MGAFLAKLPLSKSRWIRFFLFGVVGTVAVNMLRILLLGIYVGVISVNPSDFEAFHAIAGEALFLPWLASYLLLVNRLARGKTSAATRIFTEFRQTRILQSLHVIRAQLAS
jgi:thaumarchaeosortase